jgi:3'-phosphoadenosine 5'-phosphosulfate sulfotransferase (PAPS reductase)/FAD synthetase
MQNLCFGPECTILRYRSCKACILLHWTQNDVWEYLEHLANLRHVKRCKTGVSGLNALFRGTEVVKHPFYSIGPKMMFGSVSEHFANLRHVKWCKTCVFGPECTISGYRSCKASILLHWTQNEVWECYRAFRYPSARKRCKSWVSGLNVLFRGTEVVKHPFYSLGPKWCLGVFQSILLTFGM